MKQTEVQAILLKHLQQNKKATINELASATKIQNLQLLGAAKMLEDDKQIVSEKSDKGKVFRLADKAPVTTEPAKNEAQIKPKLQKKGRDVSKYVFEKSEPLPKGQCCLAILKAFIRDRKPVLSTFKAAWDDTIVQRYGVTQKLSEAKALSGDRDRYFLKDNQLLQTKDGVKLACTSQWTSERFEAFLKLAKKQGYSVKPVA